MKCPACQFNGSKVVDSRPADSSRSIRRRRECESCAFRLQRSKKLNKHRLLS